MPGYFPVGISCLGSCVCLHPAAGDVPICDIPALRSSLADLSAAKRKFADSLNEFKFRCIGDAETDDEICIGESCAPGGVPWQGSAREHCKGSRNLSGFNSSRAFPRESVIASCPKSVPAR